MNGTAWAPLKRSVLEVSVTHEIEKAALKPVDLHTFGYVCSAKRPLNDDILYYDVCVTFFTPY